MRPSARATFCARWRTAGETLPDFAAELSPEAFARQLASEDLWQVLLATSKSGSAVEKALTAGEPAHVARYAFQLAQAFSNFYHEHNVLAEPTANAGSSSCG